MRIYKAAFEFYDCLLDTVRKVPVFRGLVVQTINLATNGSFVSMLFDPVDDISVFVSV